MRKKEFHFLFFRGTGDIRKSVETGYGEKKERQGKESKKASWKGKCQDFFFFYRQNETADPPASCHKNI